MLELFLYLCLPYLAVFSSLTLFRSSCRTSLASHWLSSIFSFHWFSSSHDALISFSIFQLVSFLSSLTNLSFLLSPQSPSTLSSSRHLRLVPSFFSLVVILLSITYSSFLGFSRSFTPAFFSYFFPLSPVIVREAKPGTRGWLYRSMCKWGFIFRVHFCVVFVCIFRFSDSFFLLFFP